MRGNQSRSTPSQLAPKLSRDQAVGFISAMVLVWDLVDHDDFRPDYWVSQARALLKTGKPAPRRLRVSALRRAAR